MSHPYTAPEFNKSAFHCPHCSAYSNQVFLDVYVQTKDRGWMSLDFLKFAVCVHCGQSTLWKNGIMIDPDSAPAPFPNEDLPDEIKSDYLEARTIMAKSPRGAAALLRLCVQKLCVHLGESGKDLNADIASLVKKGLNPKIQQSLDIVRVIGNEAVHPGLLDLRDQPQTAVKLCELINIIVDTMVTQPKMIDALYEQLPATKRAQIEERDGKR